MFQEDTLLNPTPLLSLANQPGATVQPLVIPSATPAVESVNNLISSTSVTAPDIVAPPKPIKLTKQARRNAKATAAHKSDDTAQAKYVLGTQHKGINAPKQPSQIFKTIQKEPQINVQPLARKAVAVAMLDGKKL